MNILKLHTYYTPNYEAEDTDIMAVFRVTHIEQNCNN